MVARDEVAVPLNQQLLAAVTTCVLQVPNLARQIPRIYVPKTRLLANLRRPHQGLCPGVLRVGHFVVFVKRCRVPGNVRRHTCYEFC